jgi:signal transduction histidine kinase
MRDRLLLAFVSLSLAVVAVFVVVRGHATSELVHDEERRKVERSAETMAGLVGLAGGDVTGAQLASVLHDGEQVVYVALGGRRVEAAASGAPVADPKPTDLSVTRPVAGGGTLTLTRDVHVVDARVANALLPLVLVALALAMAAGVAAVWLSRRLSRPFRELAGVAERIGRGDFGVPVPRYKVPEADAVARVLRASAADLDTLVRRERDFAAHASHELRTPITATRLELEDLAFSPQTPPEVVARLSDALQQLDRLSATVAGMLDATRERRVGASFDIDLAALVRDAAARWRSAARDRSLVDGCDSVVAVRMPAGSLIQVMDVLLCNAVSHGEGTISVRVSEAPEYAEVRVADEGAHDQAVAGVKSAVAGGTGGLATATEIAESLGGQLRLTDDARTTFSLVLPRARRENVAA